MRPLDHIEGVVHAQPTRPLKTRHDAVTPRGIILRTDHLCDRDYHFRGGTEKGLDYVAWQLKQIIDELEETGKSESRPK